ncbi:MAG: hypothetical protein WA056_06850 [Gallionella sp.]
MTLAISIVAILISIASLGFNLYQYKHSKSIKHLEKCNDILRGANKLRIRSQELRNKIDSTDDLDMDHIEQNLSAFNEFVEVQLPKIMEDTNSTIAELYKLEGKLAQFESSIELLSKQIDVAVDFRKQVSDWEKRKNLE